MKITKVEIKEKVPFYKFAPPLIDKLPELSWKQKNILYDVCLNESGTHEGHDFCHDSDVASAYGELRSKHMEHIMDVAFGSKEAFTGLKFVGEIKQNYYKEIEKQEKIAAEANIESTGAMLNANIAENHANTLRKFRGPSREDLEKECKRLWALLDDISTLGDSHKPEQTSYFKAVNAACGKRDGLFTSDGFEIIPK